MIFFSSELYYLVWILAIALSILLLWIISTKSPFGKAVAPIRIAARIFLVTILFLHVLGGIMWPPNKIVQDTFVKKIAVELLNREIIKNPKLVFNHESKLVDDSDFNSFLKKYSVKFRGELGCVVI